MTDDFLTRAYADRHGDLTGGIARALAAAAETVRVSLDRLHRHDFDAPWHQDLRRRGVSHN